MAKKSSKQKDATDTTGELPTMEDRAIRPLQKLGRDYAKIRDERQQLTLQEVELKKKIRAIMHEHNRTKYEYDDVAIELEPPDGEEKVKVRVRKQKEEEETDESGEE
jgi:hypothetical protein